jgi:hypothetical protein
VTKGLGYDLRMNACGKQRRRMSMPQVVQPHRRQPGSLDEPIERVRKAVRIQVLSIAAIAD